MKTNLQALAVTLLLSGCASMAGLGPMSDDRADQADRTDEFLSTLSALCGLAFAGEVEVDREADGTPADPNSPWTTQPVVMHVRDCSYDAVRIPLHVGEDRSRTWVLTRTDAGGLRLKHDHRHEDGSEDAVTQYGGDTVAGPIARPSVSAATAIRQEFPVGAFSVALFQREGLSASTENVWAMEIILGETFVYELARPSGRLFRVRFDLTNPVPTPPPVWGYDDR
ncbi:MAG: hypothetical protein V2J26_12380 [Pacificimonas sp.]|jgi:hypothetical protein|nr:hypothetical protein [Pacificimonas sp.]